MLDVNEWDFDRCPGASKPLKSNEVDELEECWRWEFARESKLIINKVLTLRKRLRIKTFKNFHDKLRNKNSPWNNLLLDHGIYIYSPEFPHSPYLSIPKQERLDRCDEVYRGWEKASANHFSVGSSEIDEMIFNEFLSAREKGERHRISGFVEPVLVKINWRNSDDLLVKEFRNWLHFKRPKGVLKNRSGRRGSSSYFRTNLKALGAKRLLRGRTPEDARRLSKLHSGAKAPLFEHTAKWHLAEAKVDQLVSECEQIHTKLP
jgi:hypothetical protein